MNTVTVESKSALLVCNDEKTDLRRRTCCRADGPIQVESIIQLLRNYGYGIRLFREIEDRFYKGDPKKLLTEKNFDLVVVNLSGLDDETIYVLFTFVTCSVPCIFVGSSGLTMSFNIQNPTLRNLYEKLPFIACSDSFSAFLDMNRRYELYKIDSEIDKHLNGLMQSDFDNRMEGKGNGK
jgi:glutaredoxin